MDRWLTLAQACDYTAVSRWTLQRAIKANLLKAAHVNGGHTVRIHTTALDAWLTRGKKPA